jgi:hypothetical protein
MQVNTPDALTGKGKTRPVKAYIAGKVTDLPIDAVMEKFCRKQMELTAKGYYVTNPVRELQQINNFRQRTNRPIIEGWNEEMKECLALLLKCDELHLLPCWQNSKGAQLERDVAMRINMPIIYP